MPYADPEKRKAYARETMRKRRARLKGILAFPGGEIPWAEVPRLLAQMPSKHQAIAKSLITDGLKLVERHYGKPVAMPDYNTWKVNC